MKISRGEKVAIPPPKNSGLFATREMRAYPQEIKRKIVNKLFHANLWGGRVPSRYVAVEEIQRRFKFDFERDALYKAGEELYKDKWVLIKSIEFGISPALNPLYQEEIRGFLFSPAIPVKNRETIAA